MPECNYCEESFDDEEAYLRHLEKAHGDELSRVDRRRVEGVGSDDEGFNVGVAVLGLVLLGAVGLVASLVLLTGGSSADGEPTNLGAVHEHGTMEVVIDGEAVNLSEGEYVRYDEEPYFHFHGGEYDQYGAHVWHTHGEGVTLQYALGTLGFEVNDEGTVFEADARTYDDADPDTTVEITVNGEPVEPAEYELRGVGPLGEAAAGQGDDVVVEVATEE